MHRYTCPKSLTSAGSSSCYAQVFCSMSNLLLLTIGDCYIYSHDKNDERKMETGQGYGMGYGGCDELRLAATGLSLVTLFSVFMSIKDRPLLWMVIRSQTFDPEHILSYESGKAHYALVVGSGSFWTD